jgi:hypothetical protein
MAWNESKPKKEFKKYSTPHTVNFPPQEIIRDDHGKVLGYLRTYGPVGRQIVRAYDRNGNGPLGWYDPRTKHTYNARGSVIAQWSNTLVSLIFTKQRR